MLLPGPWGHQQPRLTLPGHSSRAGEMGWALAARLCPDRQLLGSPTTTSPLEPYKYTNKAMRVPRPRVVFPFTHTWKPHFTFVRKPSRKPGGKYLHYPVLTQMTTSMAVLCAAADGILGRRRVQWAPCTCCSPGVGPALGTDQGIVDECEVRRPEDTSLVMQKG